MATGNLRKARAGEIAAELQRNDGYEASSIKELVGLKLEEMRDEMMAATGEDLIRAQGGARVLKRLLDDLTRAPQRMTKEG